MKKIKVYLRPPVKDKFNKTLIDFETYLKQFKFRLIFKVIK